MSGTARPIILAAGGTGGHMFPAVALGNELIRRGHRVALFTDRRGAGYGERMAGADTHVIPAASPSRGGMIGKATFIFTLVRGAWRAIRLIRRVRPTAVVGFGGYASFPTAFMASRAGVPTILHEQNAVLGLANRKLVRNVEAIAVAFKTVLGVPNGARVVQTGNPVRAEFLATGTKAYPALTAKDKMRIMVLGGSQGAAVFSEVVPRAIELVPKAKRARLDLTQQCRPEDIDEVRAAYKRLDVKAELHTFFDDVPQRLARTHLMICRAGASTCAEVTVAGRPALFVPYPYAADDHQRHNAQELEEGGAGWMAVQAEFTPDSLAERLTGFLAKPKLLSDGAAKARKMAVRNAAARLADLVEETMVAPSPAAGKAAP